VTDACVKYWSSLVQRLESWKTVQLVVVAYLVMAVTNEFGPVTESQRVSKIEGQEEKRWLLARLLCRS